MNKEQLIETISARKARSAWDKAKNAYALELLDDAEGGFTSADLLNGAKNWSEFSYGGSSLIFPNVYFPDVMPGHPKTLTHLRSQGEGVKVCGVLFAFAIGHCVFHCVRLRLERPKCGRIRKATRKARPPKPTSLNRFLFDHAIKHCFPCSAIH